MAKTTIEPLLVSIDEAASIVGLGRSKLYELIRDGRIPVVHIGRAVRVPVAALHRFVGQMLADEGEEAER